MLRVRLNPDWRSLRVYNGSRFVVVAHIFVFYRGAGAANRLWLNIQHRRKIEVRCRAPHSKLHYQQTITIAKNGSAGR